MLEKETKNNHQGQSRFELRYPELAKEQASKSAQKQSLKLADNDNLSRADLKTLRAMNEVYCHGFFGGKNVIISRIHSQFDDLSFTFDSIAEFKKKFLHLPRIGKKTQGEAWLTWPGKNHKLNGTGFYPVVGQCPESVYNFFTGFRITPVEGDCGPYLDHLREVICSGDAAAFRYLTQWLAHLFQRPDEKPSVAIVLKSVEGTGKGTMVYPLLKILGAHGAQTNGAYAITGRFNGTLANKLLLFADEVELTDRRTTDKIKAIISEPTVMLERKGLEIEPLPNFCRLIFASNHEHVINAGTRERRYLVLSPSDHKVGDKEYFANLRRWADNGGTEALFHYLLKLDISEFNPYACPQTKALVEEKMASLPPVLGFLYREIFQDKPFGGLSRIGATELIDRFENWCTGREINMTLPMARSLIGKTMHRMGVRVLGRSDQGDGKVYEIPDRESLQGEFWSLLGLSESDFQLLN